MQKEIYRVDFHILSIPDYWHLMSEAHRHTNTRVTRVIQQTNNNTTQHEQEWEHINNFNRSATKVEQYKWHWSGINVIRFRSHYSFISIQKLLRWPYYFIVGALCDRLIDVGMLFLHSYCLLPFRFVFVRAAAAHFKKYCCHIKMIVKKLPWRRTIIHCQINH